MPTPTNPNDSPIDPVENFKRLKEIRRNGTDDERAKLLERARMATRIVHEDGNEE